MKRFFDLSFALFLLPILLLPMIIIAFLVRATSKGPSIYWSERVGKDSMVFKMPKFRSMTINAPTLATNMITNSDKYLTSTGRILRRTSLDELPQLYSIIRGDMSFVGPRPALFNETKLLALRKQHGIDKELPGITGLAQINGRDDISIYDKVNLDLEYMENKSFWLDLKIIIKTVPKVITSENISH